MVVIKITNSSFKKFGIVMAILAILGIGVFFGWRFKNIFPCVDFELTDDLGGNIFPSAILAVATTDTLVVQPSDTLVIGNPKSSIAIRIKNPVSNARLKITLGETPFFRTSVSEFILPVKDYVYTVYPDILWNYDALRNNNQAEPINISATVQVTGHKPVHEVRTFSVRSINECLLGYIDRRNKYKRTDVLLAAYVNENHPLIDEILREALNTKIVNRFMGYQTNKKGYVDKQVYALWHVLQQRNFRYSSISYSSLSSNLVFAQRVRTFEDALKSSQINCVDGSVLFASLLRAINIDPVLVRTPGHMYIGYYTDRKHENIDFLETTMIGDIDLDDFFPDEKLDSTTVGKSQKEMSRLTFDKSKEYARKNYDTHKSQFKSNAQSYMFLEITRGLRRKIQPIGK